ncbi:MAG: hypothetical protein RMY36_003310 [Nostoc sp. SerVER01]|nr:hypothetical protein [Nostoc sp. SerVER01]
MVNPRDKNSGEKPPNSNFPKIAAFLVLLVIIVVFIGGISTALVFLNWNKIFNNERLPDSPLPSPTASLSPSSTANPSPSPTASPSPSPSDSPSSSSVIKTPIGVVNRQGLTFELLGCQKSITDTATQRIQCSLNLTSTQDNSNVSLHSNYSQTRRSRLFYAGKEYIATKVDFGSYSGNSVDNNLLKNTALTAIFTFEKVPVEVNKIEVFEISSYYQGDIKVEFRNVPVSGS